MKRLATIFLLFLSFNLYSQIIAEKAWPKCIQREFNLIKKQNVDTVLVYSYYFGPWNNLPDSCNNYPSVSFIWRKDNKYYGKNIDCGSNISNDFLVSSTPLKFFVSHIKIFKLRETYFKTHMFLPPIPTDGSWENLTLMTAKGQIPLVLSENQRVDKIWEQFHWIKATIEAIDITKSELKR